MINYKNFFFTLLTVVSTLWLNSVNAYECIVDTDGDGIGDQARGVSTDNTNFACGYNSLSKGTHSIAIGEESRAGENYDNRNDDAKGAIAIGAGAATRGIGAIAIGGNYEHDMNITGAVADGHYSLSIGPESGTFGTGTIALGNSSLALGESAIAIGNNSEANKPGAIAIGTDVVADTPNTMKVGVPIRIERGDGTSQLRVTEKSSSSNVRTLMNLICDNCTPAFRFNRKFPNNQSWFFRMLQNGDFSIDDPLTTAREAQFISGGDLRIGGTLIQASSREIKTNFNELDNAEILKKIEQLPIIQWSYKKDKGKVNHIGPMAEDFYDLFKLGLNNKGISSVDTSGIALATIKALKAEKDAEIKELKFQLSEQARQLAELSELKVLVAQLISKENTEQVARVSY